MLMLIGHVSRLLIAGCFALAGILISTLRNDSRRPLTSLLLPDPLPGVLKIVVRKTKLTRLMTLIIRQSRIHSYGCYTTRPIRKGTLIVEYVGERLTYEQADELYEDFGNTYLFGLDGGKHIIDGYGVAAFVNHSCKPNCETDQIRGKMWIIAQRDIAAGEELTYDYNLYDGDEDAPCLCGARRCRGSLYSATHLRKLTKKRAKAAATPSSAA
jgi:hypothetical protein